MCPFPKLNAEKKAGLIHGSEDEMGRINSNQFYSNSIIISVLIQIKNMKYQYAEISNSVLQF